MFLAREDDYSCGYGAASSELKSILYKDGNYKNVLTLMTDNMRNIPMKLTQGKEFRCCYYVVIDSHPGSTFAPSKVCDEVLKQSILGKELGAPRQIADVAVSLDIWWQVHG